MAAWIDAGATTLIPEQPEGLGLGLGLGEGLGLGLGLGAATTNDVEVSLVPDGLTATAVTR
jgi:hypothetical protein